MKRFSSTKIILVAVVILNLIGFFGCVVIFREIKNKSENISSIRNELEQESAKESRYLSIKGLIEETAEDREKIDSYFIPSEGVVGFLELLEKQSALSGVQASIVSVRVNEDDTIASSTIETLALEVEAEGGWKEMHHFFSLAENLPYNISPKDVDINSSRTGKTNLWQANFIFH